MIGFSYANLNPDFDPNEPWAEDNLKFLPLTEADRDNEAKLPVLKWIKTRVKAQMESGAITVNLKEPIYLRFQGYAEYSRKKGPPGMKKII